MNKTLSWLLTRLIIYHSIHPLNLAHSQLILMGYMNFIAKLFSSIVQRTSTLSNLDILNQNG